MIDGFPKFRPHPLIRGGHLQTLAGAFLPWKRSRERAAPHRIALPDGDALVLHDDRPETWRHGHRAVLLMHGLAGCYRSPYMIRTSRKLNDAGVRSFRLDLRGCGAGRGLARLPYHAGRSDDAFQALAFIRELCPGSPIGLVGFSLSGNIVLKLLGENPQRLAGILDRAVAVNPPIDLKRSVAAMDRFANRTYDRHFVALLNGSVQQLRRACPDLKLPQSYRRPRRLYDFDDCYTAPAAGFRDAEDYYARCSANQFLHAIAAPTLILTARDDPLVPVAQFESAAPSEAVALHIAASGGHLGYVARRGADPDRRWMDWRILDWLTRSVGREDDTPRGRE